VTPKTNRRGEESREPFTDDLPREAAARRAARPKPRREQADEDLARLAERMEREERKEEQDG